MNTCCSHVPLPALRRSRVIRLPPLPPLPDSFLIRPAISALGVEVASVPGLLASTTSTSPLGSARSWRGCFRSLAIFSICSPSATFGVWPAFQPTPLGTRIGGTRKSCAAGSGGLLPDCSIGSYDALWLHAPMARQANARAPAWMHLFMNEVSRGGVSHGDQDM